MLRLLTCFLCLCVASAWRLPVRCLAQPNLRHEMDMLARFTGHDQWDRYTKNWLRQHAIQRTLSLAAGEQVESLRILRGNRLCIISDKRRWDVDLATGTTLRQLPLHRTGRYSLSMNGNLYHVAYDASAGRHVLRSNGHPMMVLDEFPWLVTESMDGNTACVNVCSEDVVMARLDAEGHPSAIKRLAMRDVALASVGLKEQTFHGLLGGKVCAYDMETGKTVVHTLRRPQGLVVPSVRCIDVDATGFTTSVVAGCQDGSVRALRYDSSGDAPDMTEFANRRLHRTPVTQIRFQCNRVASAGDDDGSVVVTDLHGTKTMYTMTMDGSGDVSLDLDRRFLVVGRGNTIKVWDHDVSNDVRRPHLGQRRGSQGKKGGGGGVKIVL